MNDEREVIDDSTDSGGQAAATHQPTRSETDVRRQPERVASASTRARRRITPLQVVIATAVVLLLVAIVAWRLSSQTDERAEAAPTVEVEVTRSVRAEMREYVEVSGTLNAMPGREASFSAPTGGRVTHVLVEVGNHVNAGQTLAELDKSVLSAQVRQAEAALQQARATSAQARTASGAQSQTLASDQIRQAEVALTQARANQAQAQNNLGRLQRLYERSIAARKEVEEAQTQATVTTGAVAQAQSALDAARANASRGLGEARTQASVSAGGVAAAQAQLAVAQAELARASIRSPIGGVVTRRAVNDGETVDPATPVFDVIEASSLDLIANLPAEYLERIKTGNLALVRVEPFPGREFKGGVVQVAPSVDAQTNTVAVRLRLPNPAGELKAGLFASARIAVEIHANALNVPEAALVVEGDEAFLFVPREDATVEKRRVTVGIRDGGRVEIAEGLKESERVVTTGAFGLSDGAKIKIVEASNGNEEEAKPAAGSETP
jgi:HlyD family secretion protein